MLFTAGVVAALQARGKPVITAFDLHVLAQDLFAQGSWRGEPLQRLPRDWDQQRTVAMLSRLLRRGTLAIDGDFGPGVYRVLNVDNAGTAEEIACLVDPFCYVSYQSALHSLGLVPTRSAPLRLTTPEAKQWKALYAKRLQALTADKDGLRPNYPRIGFGEKLRRRSIAIHQTATVAPTVTIGLARVSTIPATFADTLAEPARCNGMAAVLKLWDGHARQHVREIAAYIDRTGSKIVKVRAGYIFTERLGIETPTISSWVGFAQRGGSRRLDPERPYASTFSERWMLSLNSEAS